MINRVKQTMAYLLVFVMIFGMFACGSETSSQVQEKTKIVVGVNSNAKVLNYGDNALTKWLEQTCNVDLEFVEYSVTYDHLHDLNESALMTKADILWGMNFSNEIATSFCKEDYFVDLRPYYEDKEGASATFWKRIETLPQVQQAQIINAITEPNTSMIYAVPTVETTLTDGICSMAWINQTWLDKLSLNAPTDPQSLYTVLKAFQNDGCEYPLFGTQNSDSSAAVVDWLINMFIYYNPDHPWQDYNGDGKLESVYTQDAYKEALQFVHTLYEEKLLSHRAFSASSGDMKNVFGYEKGNVGVFLGDLTSHVTYKSEALNEYVALKPFGCAVEEDISCVPSCVITSNAAEKGITDQCFGLLMTMWSEEGSLRIRYGEYGVNWTDADEGAKSAYGLDATYKVLDDPVMQQSAAQWGKTAGTFLQYADGETAQIEEQDPWVISRSQMYTQARQYFDWAAENINPNFLKDPFLEKFELNATDDEAIVLAVYNMNDVIHTYLVNFVTGAIGYDIDKDTDWQKYLEELKALGYDDVLAMYQKYYEKQK